MIAVGLYGTFLTFVSVWGIPFLIQTYHIPRDAAANYMFVAQAGFMIGQPLFGYLSDKVFQNRKQPAIFSSATMVVVWLVLIAWNGGHPPLSFMYPICFLLGVATSFTIIIHVCTKEVSHPVVSGLALGLVNLGIFVTAAAIEILCGYLLDVNWEGNIVNGVRIYSVQAFQAAFTSCFIVSAFAVIGSLLLRETGCRDVYEELPDFAAPSQ